MRKYSRTSGFDFHQAQFIVDISMRSDYIRCYFNILENTVNARHDIRARMNGDCSTTR